MARCGCTSATCSCVVKGGTGTSVTGSGSATNPYIVTAESGDIGGLLQVFPTDTVILSLGGHGTENEPYALTAMAQVSLDELTDVAAATPAPGQVLTWDDSIFQWVPQNVAAPPGSVAVDAPLHGDGSAGNNIGLTIDPDGSLVVGPNGLAVSDEGRAAIIPKFPNAAARDAAITAPVKGDLVWLDTPGDYSYWDGTAWQPLTGVKMAAGGTPWFNKTPYIGQRTWQVEATRILTTDANGDTVVLPSAQVPGGVISGAVTGASTFPITATLRIITGNLVARIWSGGVLAKSTSVAVSYRLTVY